MAGCVVTEAGAGPKTYPPLTLIRHKTDGSIMARKPPPTKLFAKDGNEAFMDAEGKLSVTSSGGVEMVADAQGKLAVAGLNAFGISDLVDVERIDTAIDGDRTTFTAVFRGGGSATIVYDAGQFAAYQGANVALTILNRTTKALIGSPKE